MSAHSRLIAEDPELGPVRFCVRCDEWLPDDAEFWYTSRRGYLTCQACQAEWGAARYRRLHLLATRQVAGFLDRRCLDLDPFTRIIP